MGLAVNKENRSSTGRRPRLLALAFGVVLCTAVWVYRDDLRRPLLNRSSTSELRQQALASPGDALLARVAAERCLSDGRPADAVDLLLAAKSRQPQNLELEVLTGRALLEAGRIQEAGVLLKGLLERKPEHAEARYWMGEVLYAQGYEDTARELFQEVTRLKPEMSRAWLKAGELLLTEEHFAAALESLDRAERLRPDSETARIRGAALRSLGRIEEAEQAVRQAVDRDPNDSLAHYALGDLLQSKGGPEELLEAEEHLQRSVRLRPTHDNLKTLAGVSRRLKKYRQAANALRQLIRMAPATTEAYLLLGQAYQALGRPELARWCVATYRRLEPLEKRVSRALYQVNVRRGHPDAQLDLVRVYIAVGRQDLARENLQRIRLKHPHLPQLPALERQAADAPTLHIPPLPPDSDADDPV